jgi:CheY-like chemotaxis protein
VLKIPAGRQLAELADSSHRHESAAEWQADLIAVREVQRRTALLRGWMSSGGRYLTKVQERQKRILLVKDNEAFREAFARMLELELTPEINVAFVKADSLAEAHNWLQEEDGLDAALIDIGLPDGDGLDLVRELDGNTGRIGSLPTLVKTANLDHSLPHRRLRRVREGCSPKWSRSAKRWRRDRC